MKNVHILIIEYEKFGSLWNSMEYQITGPALLFTICTALICIDKSALSIHTFPRLSSIDKSALSTYTFPRLSGKGCFLAVKVTIAVSSRC